LLRRCLPVADVTTREIPSHHATCNS
jgi:hypothetical protein